MENITLWLTENEIYLKCLIATLIIVVLAIPFIVLAAFIQGRKICLWPPAIGEKPTKSDAIKNATLKKEYDLFISAPMTSITPSEYESTREDILTINKHFRDNCNMKNIHYVGERVVSPSVADPPAISIEDDLDHLAKSKNYILFYPKPLLTSCIVEAGYALGLGIPSIYFVKNKADLPYMLREAAESNKSVAVYVYKDTKDLTRIITQHKTRLFKKLHEEE